MITCTVLELCHSRWFYYFGAVAAWCSAVLELCHSRWFYYFTLISPFSMLFWNYVIPDGSTTREGLALAGHGFWNYVIPDGSTTHNITLRAQRQFWNYVIPDGSTTEHLPRCNA